jgi:hypothetical protein
MTEYIQYDVQKSENNDKKSPQDQNEETLLNLEFNSDGKKQNLKIKRKKKAPLTYINLLLGFLAGAVWRLANVKYAYMLQHPLSTVFYGAFAGSMWTIPTSFVDSCLPSVFKPILSFALMASIYSYVSKMT